MQPFNEFFSQNWIVLIVVGSLLLFCTPWLFVWLSRRNRAKLLANGRSTPAKLLMFRNSGLTIGSSSGNNSSQGGNMRGVKLLLEVQPPNGQPYLVKTREQLHLFDISRLTPGMMVEVKVAKNNSKQVVISNWSSV